MVFLWSRCKSGHTFFALNALTRVQQHTHTNYTFRNSEACDVHVRVIWEKLVQTTQLIPNAKKANIFASRPVQVS